MPKYFTVRYMLLKFNAQVQGTFCESQGLQARSDPVCLVNLSCPTSVEIRFSSERPPKSQLISLLLTFSDMPIKAAIKIHSRNFVQCKCVPSISFSSGYSNISNLSKQMRILQTGMSKSKDRFPPPVLEQNNLSTFPKELSAEWSS